MSNGDARAQEVAAKLALAREALAGAADGAADGAGGGALRLRGADWFAWATAGAEAAGAELLVTRAEACILTDATGAERLRAAALPTGFTFHAAPWAEPELHDSYVRGAAGESAILSDRPQAGELALPASLRLRRMALLPAEQERLRALGRDAAVAVSAVLRAARADWTGYELAGASAAAFWQRGVQVATIDLANVSPASASVAAAAARDTGTSHGAAVAPSAAPSLAPLGAGVQLTVGARRHGLHVTFARGVRFGPQDDANAEAAQAALLQVEATGLDAVRPGLSLAAVYHAFDAAYRHVDRPDAIGAHHQGGIAGYAPHELLASASTATGLEAGMAFAFNPAIDGLRVADTFLLGAAGLECLTVDPDWPVTTIQGRARPAWLEAP